MTDSLRRGAAQWAGDSGIHLLQLLYSLIRKSNQLHEDCDSWGWKNDEIVQITLKFTHSEKHPGEAPIYEIFSQENQEDNDVSSISKFFSLQVEETLVWWWSLVTAVQEKLNEIVDQIKTRREEEKKRKEKEAEEAEKVY